jgi:hypothetical protein
MPMRQPPCESLPVPGVTTRGLALHRALHADHVLDRNAFGDRDGEIKAGIDALEDRVAGERWRHEDRGDGGAGGVSGFGDRVEDRDPVAGVFEELAAFAGRDAGDELRAVVERELGVASAEIAGDALDENFSFGGDEDGHGIESSE